MREIRSFIGAVMELSHTSGWDYMLKRSIYSNRTVTPIL